MKSSLFVASLICLTVGTVLVAAAQPPRGVDPRGNLSGIWIDQFGNEFIITQRGNRRIAVKYLKDAGNLIWHCAHGQARKEGNRWILHMNLHLKEGGLRPRKGEVVAGAGSIVWPKGNRWTLVATPQMQVEQLAQALFAAQTHAAKLTTELIELQQLLQRKNAVNARLKDALAAGRADARQLQEELAELDKIYKRDVGAIMGEYLDLEREYSDLLRQKNISDRQRQQIAEQLEKIKDLAKPLVGLNTPQPFVRNAPLNPLNW